MLPILFLMRPTSYSYDDLRAKPSPSLTPPSIVAQLRRFTHNHIQARQQDPDLQQTMQLQYRRRGSLHRVLFPFGGDVWPLTEP